MLQTEFIQGSCTTAHLVDFGRVDVGDAALHCRLDRGLHTLPCGLEGAQSHAGQLQTIAQPDHTPCCQLHSSHGAVGVLLLKLLLLTRKDLVDLVSSWHYHVL